MTMTGMELHGRNLIGSSTVGGDTTFTASNPTVGSPLPTSFHEATSQHVDRAVREAGRAFDAFRRKTPETRATFLEHIAAALEDESDRIVDRATRETGLSEGRLRGELTRTTNQLRMFADLVREGSWVDARIDRGDPDRTPTAKPDIRRMLVPLGPVAVFGASNFPLAFSVAGGDTASALAAGCPVIVKAHPAHPGTSEWVGRTILEAARATDMPAGVFSMVHGTSHEVGLALVRHPLVRAVGFTGSLRGGRALFDAAAARPDPIPVYAEMGSINPVFVMPSVLVDRPDGLAADFVASLSLGVGQFCTNPGVLVVPDDDGLDTFLAALRESIGEIVPASMLHAGIRTSYLEGVSRLEQHPDHEVLARSDAGDASCTHAPTVAFLFEASAFVADRRLHEEVFGPATVVVRARDVGEMIGVAESLEGQLTATVHGTPAELTEGSKLVETLKDRVGRLVFNGFPTGVEVGNAMHHGGPYPATTNPKYTSVGTAAIERFVRPISFQDAPQNQLPPELADDNPRSIRRLVDGHPEGGA